MEKRPPIAAITQNFALYSGNKTHAPLEKFQAKRKNVVAAEVAVAVAVAVSGRKRSASNSNQGSPNTQTHPTLTLFLPLQVHGSWLGLLQSSHWKSGAANVAAI